MRIFKQRSINFYHPKGLVKYPCLDERCHTMYPRFLIKREKICVLNITQIDTDTIRGRVNFGGLPPILFLILFILHTTLECVTNSVSSVLDRGFCVAQKVFRSGKHTSPISLSRHRVRPERRTYQSSMI